VAAVAGLCAAVLTVWLTAPAPVTTSSVTTNDAEVGTGNGTFSYRGTWETGSGDPAKYRGDDHYSDSAGSSFTYRFSGTSVSLFGAKAPHHGQASVQIDDGPVAVIDQYAPSRQDDALLYTSPTLAAGDHVVTVTVTGTRRSAATGNVVAIDRVVAKATTSPASRPTTASPSPSPSPSASPSPKPARVVFSESGDGPDLRPYASTTLNDRHPLWHVEPGSAPVNRVDGKLIKMDSARFHRMFSTRRFGGPGKTITISYRGRATEIRDHSDSSTIAGAKIGLKFPVASELTGYSKADPRSVYGNSSQDDDDGPGSLIFLTGLTDDGYLELARNGYGSEGYSFADSLEVGYSAGTWQDVTVTVDWLPDGAIRVRYWHNADGSGAPIYEATDNDSPFAADPGFLWLRTDSTNWEYDYITIREQ